MGRGRPVSGAASRRKGHAYEQEVSRELREATGLHVVTTRSLGATYGSDICTVVALDGLGRPVVHVPSVRGWAIEVKNVRKRNPSGWLKQACDQAAPGTTPVVLWRRARKPFREGSAFTVDEDAPRGWREEPISVWLDRLLKETDDADVA